MRIAKTKIALALGMLVLAAQAQADQLADIKAAGVVKSPPSTPTRRSAR